MSKRDGGPAFPQNKALPPIIGGFPAFEQVGGMTLWDYFAGQALAGLMAKEHMVTLFRGEPVEPVGYSTIARQACEIADAMLAEREKEQTP